MKKKIFVALFTTAALFTHSALAERYYQGTKLQRLIQGKTVKMESSGVINYKSNGIYKFMKFGGTFNGRYWFTSEKVCVQFTNGKRRCDRYLKDGKSIYFETRDGSRFKVKSIR